MQTETSSPVQPNDSRVSRRLFIKAGVAAGGAAWAAPAIESFTSSAAAGSVPTQGTPNFGCSWVYIVWAQTDDETFYYTGWQGSGANDGTTTCNSQASYPSTSKSKVSTTCQDFTYTLVPTKSPPPKITVTPPSSPTVDAQYSDGCANFSYSTDGKTVVAVRNVAILAVFTHGGGGSNAAAHCPIGLFGNSISISCAS